MMQVFSYRIRLQMHSRLLIQGRWLLNNLLQLSKRLPNRYVARISGGHPSTTTVCKSCSNGLRFDHNHHEHIQSQIHWTILLAQLQILSLTFEVLVVIGFTKQGTWTVFIYFLAWVLITLPLTTFALILLLGLVSNYDKPAADNIFTKSMYLDSSSWNSLRIGMFSSFSYLYLKYLGSYVK